MLLAANNLSCPPRLPYTNRLLPYLREKGLGVINASVLSMGLLTHQVRTSQTIHLETSVGLLTHIFLRI